MQLKLWVSLIALFFIFSNQLISQSVKPERQWPGFKGYYSRGVLDNANLPDTWGVEKSENLKWKIKISGMGLSYPAIWGEKIFKKEYPVITNK